MRSPIAHPSRSARQTTHSKRRGADGSSANADDDALSLGVISSLALTLQEEREPGGCCRHGCSMAQFSLSVSSAGGASAASDLRRFGPRRKSKASSSSSSSASPGVRTPVVSPVAGRMALARNSGRGQRREVTRRETTAATAAWRTLRRAARVERCPLGGPLGHSTLTRFDRTAIHTTPGFRPAFAGHTTTKSTGGGPRSVRPTSASRAVRVRRGMWAQGPDARLRGARVERSQPRSLRCFAPRRSRPPTRPIVETPSRR